MSYGARAKHEPIAIVGMGCRLPGAGGVEQFWDLLRRGEDAVREVPAERWNVDEVYAAELDAPGKTNCRWGGFVDDVRGFDWRAFEVSPREARQMDPQHRLLLEVSWEALEDAGIRRSAIAGKRVGVFIGVMWNDYLRLMAADPNAIGPYSLVGNGLAFAANRISYFYDLRGPSVAMEVGCASSLIAIHMACRTIWSGEAPLALAGGVNLLLSPDNYVITAKGGVLSPDGRCKTFDAGANGFVPGEGAGVVVLKPLSQARADGDRIYAQIRGTAANHNGHTPWIMAVDQKAQEELLRDALDDAQLAPEQMDYIELHGTGTRLGDPVEAKAVGAVVGQARDAGSPCRVGSVKTNIGHLESAGSVSHVIKVALALHHGELPPSLHMTQLNPAIDQQALNIQLQTELGPWPDKEAPAVAGVTSLSLGGGNAHIVLEQAERPRATTSSSEQQPALLPLLPLSALCAESLRGLAQRHVEVLRREPAPDARALRDICYTASVRRDHYTHRLAVSGTSAAQLADALEAALAGELPPAVEPRRAVVLFPDQPLPAPQVRALMNSVAVFRTAVEAVDRLVPTNEGRRLSQLLTETGEAPAGLTHTTQLAVASGLLALWSHWGVPTAAVIGRGGGALAGALACGILDLPQALAVATRLDGVTSAPLAKQTLPGRRGHTPLFVGDGTRAVVGPEVRPDRWTLPVGEPAQEQAVAHVLQALDVSDGLEVVLLGAGTAATGKHPAVALLHPEDADVPLALSRFLCQAYGRGLTPRWEALFPASCRCTALPSYPWNRQDLWLKSKGRASGASVAAAPDPRGQQEQHPLLGQRLALPQLPKTQIWQRRLSSDPVQAAPLGVARGDALEVPPAALVQAAQAAGEVLHGGADLQLTELSFSAPLLLAPGDEALLQVSVDGDSGALTVHSRPADDGPWVQHLGCTVQRRP